MAAKRQARWLVAALLAMSLLAACSSSDGEPVVKPTSDAPSATTSAPADPDGLTPEQREVVDAVDAYNAAIVGRGAAPVGPAIKNLVTKDVYDFIEPAETKAIDDAGLQYLGQVTLKPTAVTITGDKAVVKGCQDGSKAFVVKKGATAPGGVGDRAVGFSTISFGLVRQDGAWLISNPESKLVGSC